MTSAASPATTTRAVPFDNRSSRLPDRLAALLGRTARGGRHFRFQANGRTITYCYIRKNACSAFKKLITGVSPHQEQLAAHPEAMSFLSRHHRVRSLRDLMAADHRIFVYRDPIERAVSLYKNKFIAQLDHTDIFASYHRRTGRDPLQASFRDYVLHYLGHDQSALDPHCHSQIRQLAPALYTEAIPMRSLHEAMAGILGADLAGRYFRIRVNATEAVEDPAPAAHRAAADLHEAYQASGRMPANAALLEPALLQRLQELYADDLAMVQALAVA
jgi:hypothetical protein